MKKNSPLRWGLLIGLLVFITGCARSAYSPLVLAQPTLTLVLVREGASPLPGPDRIIAAGQLRYYCYTVATSRLPQYAHYLGNCGFVQFSRLLTPQEGKDYISRYNLQRRDGFYDGWYQGAQLILREGEAGFTLTVGQPAIVTDA